MPSVRIMWGGWVAWPAGNVRVYWGGWISPRLIYAKVPAGWADTGYSTYPNTPVSFYVTGWSFSVVNLQWSAPSGGTPPSYYQVVQTDSAGNWISAPTTTGGTWSFSVGQDGMYQFFVRSFAPNGLASAWAGPIKVGIGHNQQTAQRWAQRSRAWQSPEASNWQYNGTVVGATAPAYSTAYGFATGVVVTDIRMNFWSPAGFTQTWSGYDQEAYYLWNNTAGAPSYLFHYPIPYNGWFPHPVRGNWSNGGYWGIWLTGAGWNDVYGTPPFWSYVLLAGTEYYPELETYVTVNYRDNYYW